MQYDALLKAVNDMIGECSRGIEQRERIVSMEAAKIRQLEESVGALRSVQQNDAATLALLRRVPALFASYSARDESAFQLVRILESELPRNADGKVVGSEPFQLQSARKTLASLCQHAMLVVNRRERDDGYMFVSEYEHECVVCGKTEPDDRMGDVPTTFAGKPVIAVHPVVRDLTKSELNAEALSQKTVRECATVEDIVWAFVGTKIASLLQPLVR